MKIRDLTCPFCGAGVTGIEAVAPPPRVSRAMLIVLGAAGMLTTAAAVQSCGNGYGSPPDGYGGGYGGGSVGYGGGGGGAGGEGGTGGTGGGAPDAG